MDMTNLKRSEAEFFANLMHDQYMLEEGHANKLYEMGVNHGYNIKEIKTKGEEDRKTEQTKGVEDRKTKSVPSVTIHKGNGGGSTTEGDKNRRALAKAKELGIDVSGYFIKDRRDNPTGKFDYAKLAYDHPELYK
jgi:hypothetical protein